MKIQRLNQQNYIKNMDFNKKDPGPVDKFTFGDKADDLEEQLKALQNMKSTDEPSRIEGLKSGMLRGVRNGIVFDVVTFGLPFFLGGFAGAAIPPVTLGLISGIDGYNNPGKFV